MEPNEFSSDASTQGQTSGATVNETQTDTQGMADRARGLADNAKDRLADVGSSARERAGHLKNSLADVLDSGAEKLRHRAATPSGELGAATGSGSVAIEGDGRTTQVTTRVASGMSATADWLRDADLDGLKSGLEHQVKEHPGRTLLIAVGMGYLLGKAFRR